jgi:hypothetical protein
MAAVEKDCCTSCHEDHDEGYCDMIDRESPDGSITAYVCCEVSRRIKDWTQEQWADALRRRRDGL